MENELEKSCKLKDLVVGERYTLMPSYLSAHFFIVLSKHKNQVEIVWNDGKLGILTYNTTSEGAEFYKDAPLTPVEKLLW
jgi:hypothetical protein